MIKESSETADTVVRTGVQYEENQLVYPADTRRDNNGISRRNDSLDTSEHNTFSFKSGWISGVLMSLVVITIVPIIPMIIAFVVGIFINRNIKENK